MKEAIAQALMTYPYFKDPQDDVTKELKRIADSRVFSSKLNQFLNQLITDFLDRDDCLIHGDCHTQNILVKGDDVKVHRFLY